MLKGKASRGEEGKGKLVGKRERKEGKRERKKDEKSRKREPIIKISCVLLCD